MRFNFPTFIAALLFTQTVNAQVLTYNTWIGSNGFRPFSTIATFDASSGELIVPSVRGIGTGNWAGQIVYDAIFKLKADGHFELTDFNAPLPEQECTRDEVQSAIASLTLELTIAQATELIGCLPNYTGRFSPEDDGKIVQAGWVGADGQINPAPGTSSDTNIPTTYYTFVSSNFGTTTQPSITLHLLDGELFKVSFTEIAQAPECENIVFADTAENISNGQTYDQVANILGCEGLLTGTSISDAETEQQYRWNRFELFGIDTSQTNYDPPRNTISETIEAVFLNGALTDITYSSNEHNTLDEPCTAAELDEVFPLLDHASPEQQIVENIPCTPDSKSISYDNNRLLVNYSWTSRDAAPSAFVATNRRLTLQVINGTTTSLSLIKQ